MTEPKVSESLKILLERGSRFVCAMFFIAAGLYHFVNPTLYLKIMPAYLPFPLELILLSGIVEVLAGLALLLKRSRPAAVWVLILLLIAVFPANINMAAHPELTPSIPIWALYIRLPLQAVIVLWVWSCVRDSEQTASR